MKMKFETCKSKKIKLVKMLSQLFVRRSSTISTITQVVKISMCNPIVTKEETISKRPKGVEDISLTIHQSRTSGNSKTVVQIIKDRNQMCEDMSFNPWRALSQPSHGWCNRIRLEVYVKQAKMRHKYNGVDHPGPK